MENDGGSGTGSFRCPIESAPSGSAFQHIAPMQHGAGSTAWHLRGTRDVAPFDVAEEQAAAPACSSSERVDADGGTPPSAPQKTANVAVASCASNEPPPLPSSRGAAVGDAGATPRCDSSTPVSLGLRVERPSAIAVPVARKRDVWQTLEIGPEHRGASLVPATGLQPGCVPVSAPSSAPTEPATRGAPPPLGIATPIEAAAERSPWTDAAASATERDEAAAPQIAGDRSPSSSPLIAPRRLRSTTEGPLAGGALVPSPDAGDRRRVTFCSRDTRDSTAETDLEDDGGPEDAGRRPVVERASTVFRRRRSSKQGESATPPHLRPWIRYAAASAAGCDRSGEAKPNQDRTMIAHVLGGVKDLHLFGVCDGHGEHGAHAAQFVASRLPQVVAQRVCESDLPWPSLVRGCGLPAGGAGVSGALTEPQFLAISGLLRAAIDAVQAEMFAPTALGAFDLSGTTLVAALLVGDHAVVANVGDSRCMLCRWEPVQPGGPAATEERAAGDRRARSASTADDQSSESLARPGLLRAAPRADAHSSPTPTPGGSPARRVCGPPARTSLRCFPLTAEHSPSVPGEASRIVARGGFLAATPGDPYAAPGPLRVWNPRAHDGRLPGLAMTRSVGDLVATLVGVTCDPTVTYHRLDTKRDRALVLASDGVWDVLRGCRVARIIAASSSVHDAALAIVERARRVWRRDGGGRTDDVTVLVLDFAPILPGSSDAAR